LIHFHKREMWGPSLLFITMILLSGAVSIQGRPKVKRSVDSTPATKTSSTDSAIGKANKQSKNPKEKNQLPDPPQIIVLDPVEKEFKFNPTNEKTTIEDAKEAIELRKAMDDELKQYHEVQEKIKFLEKHLEEHANSHVVRDNEIREASETLRDMREKIINPLEHNLQAVRHQIIRMNHALLKDEDKIFIKSVLDNADKFLETSKSRLDSLELVDQDWESLEESAKITMATSQMKPYQKVKSGQLADGSKIGALRSNRQRKINNLLAAKMDKHEEELRMIAEEGKKKKKMEIKNVDIIRLKQELDREMMIDTEPGYARKIKAALKDAAQKSHKFIHDKLSHAHPDEEGSISWALVYIFGSATILLTCCLLWVLVRRPPTLLILRRKLYKAKEDEASFGYCELNDVRGEKPNSMANPTSSWGNVVNSASSWNSVANSASSWNSVANSASSWNDSSWGAWEDQSRNSQKLK